MQKTLAEEVAEFGCDLTFDQIPGDAVEKAKLLILDTVAISISSTRMPFGTGVIDLVAGWGGAPQASVFGISRKLPAQNAALCNGILAHGQDYDDTHTESVVHPTAALFPVAMAVAEQTRASGRDMLAALIAGTEAAIRIGLPVPNKFHQRGFHTTTVTTAFGSALIAAKLKGFDARQTANALGICGSFVAGLVECVPAGADAKRLHAGWGGHCGITAAQFAEIGYSGPLTVFEGKLGLYNSLLRGEAPDMTGLFASLGREWEVLNIRPKLYPCCHYLQAYLDCATILRREHRIQPDQIQSIDCRTAQGAVNIVCEPWDTKLNPTTGYGARFSLPFAVSLMLAKGQAGSEEFTEKYLSDPEIRALMGKVKYEVDPQYQVKDMPGWLAVTLKSGEKYAYELPCVRGDKNNPIHASEIKDKFEANAAFLPPSTRAKLVSDILRLEEFGDVCELAEQFSVPELAVAHAVERRQTRNAATATA
jgi:2-methylcitrate dehydratase PrpD